MPGWQVFAMGMASAMAVFGLVWLWPRRVPKGRSVAEIEQRVAAEDGEGTFVGEQGDADMNTDVWPVGYPHEAPDRPMGLLEAKLTMQRHKGCSVGECARKTAAWQALVEAGKIRPDTGRSY